MESDSSAEAVSSCFACFFFKKKSKRDNIQVFTVFPFASDFLHRWHCTNDLFGVSIVIMTAGCVCFPVSNGHLISVGIGERLEGGLQWQSSLATAVALATRRKGKIGGLGRFRQEKAMTRVCSTRESKTVHSTQIFLKRKLNDLRENDFRGFGRLFKNLPIHLQTTYLDSQFLLFLPMLLAMQPAAPAAAAATMTAAMPAERSLRPWHKTANSACIGKNSCGCAMKSRSTLLELASAKEATAGPWQRQTPFFSSCFLLSSCFCCRSTKQSQARKANKQNSWRK